MQRKPKIGASISFCLIQIQHVHLFGLNDILGHRWFGGPNTLGVGAAFSCRRWLLFSLGDALQASDATIKSSFLCSTRGSDGLRVPGCHQGWIY